MGARGRTHPAVSAVPVLVETVGTGQETGEDGLASKPAAGAATTAGCPTKHFSAGAGVSQAGQQVSTGDPV